MFQECSVRKILTWCSQTAERSQCNI